MRHGFRKAGACLSIIGIIIQSFCFVGSAIGHCINYGDYLRWVGGVATSGIAYDVVVCGNYAYVASHFSILQVVDISDPQDVKIVGRIDTPPGGADPWIDVAGYAIAVSGTYACVASSYGLFVVDIGNPENPQIVGRLGEILGVRDCAISGGLFYAVNGSGLYVIDITNPQSPKIVAAVGTPGQATGVAVSGNLVYVADGALGLRVYDISDQGLRFLGSVDTPGGAFDVAVSGNLAYLAEDQNLRVIDVSHPTTPRIVSSVEMWARGGVVVSGSIAYVAGWGLRAVDVTNPDAPQILGGMTWADAFGITVSGDHAYLADRWGLHVFDITNLQTPAPLGSVMPDRHGEFDEVAVSGTVAYVVEYDEDNAMHFSVIEIGEGARPRILGKCWLSSSGEGLKIAVSGNYAYVSGHTVDDDDRHFYHFWVIDISDAARPRIVTHTNMEARDLAVSGNLLYVAAGDIGLEVIDVSNPGRPLLVWRVDTPGQASGVAVAGPHVCVADGSSGLQVFDVTNPQSPQLLGSVDTQGVANDVAVSGRFAYLADGPSGLQVIDITNPASPEIVGGVTTWDSRSIAVSGTTAYVRGLGLHVIDVSNPRTPELAGQAGGEWVAGFALSGEYVCIAADDNHGLLVRPLQCASSPQPPIASAGGPYTGECHMPLTFDASSSVSPTGSIVSYEWDWDGDGIFDETTSAPTVVHTYVTAFSGSVHLRVIDDQDPPMSSECEAQVSVADTKPPQIVTVELVPDQEWLKSQQMVALQLSVASQDLCDPSPTSRIVSVTTQPPNQPNGNHATRQGVGISDALSLTLPLDFSRGRTGCLYLVTVTSSDETDNSSAATAAIRVASDRGRPMVRLESLDLNPVPPSDPSAPPLGSPGSRPEETGEVSKSDPSVGAPQGSLALGLVGTFPNPMGNQGQVQFFLPATARVRLAIYDVRGRLVRTLARGGYSPGLHAVSWEARADDGSAFGQGIYFARLDVDGQRFSYRFVVVR